MSKPRWINEKEAAEKLGYKPDTLRRYVKSGKLDISFTTVRGKKFQYDEKGIDKVLNTNAQIIAI